MNVIIVEDEHLTAVFLQDTLEKLGCRVIGHFDQGIEVLDFVADNPVDFVIMDVELEGEVNGVQAAIALRQRYNIPSVFITSHNDSSTINEAMQAEPLGYVIKPITVSHVESVVGVVRGLLGTADKPQPKAHSGLTPLGLGYSYNYETKDLFFNDAPIDLTANERKLFDLCLRRRGNIVPYEVLDEQVWQGKIVTDSTRRGLFHRLRNKLDNHFFETVTGIGCRVQLPRK